MNANGTGTKWFISWNKNTVRHGIFMGIYYVHYAAYYTVHTTLTLCISWSGEGAVFFVLGHLAMSSLLPCPESTDAHCPFLGVRGPLPPKWRPLSQDPRTHKRTSVNIRTALIWWPLYSETMIRNTASGALVLPPSPSPPSLTALGSCACFWSAGSCSVLCNWLGGGGAWAQHWVVKTGAHIIKPEYILDCINSTKWHRNSGTNTTFL
jgi:hypothetical protein